MKPTMLFPPAHLIARWAVRGAFILALFLMSSCRANKVYTETGVHHSQTTENAAINTATFAAIMDSIAATTVLDIDSIVIRFASIDDKESDTTKVPKGNRGLPGNQPRRIAPQSASVYGVHANRQESQHTSTQQMAVSESSYNRIKHEADSTQVYSEVRHPPNRTCLYIIAILFVLAFIIFLIWKIKRWPFSMG